MTSHPKIQFNEIIQTKCCTYNAKKDTSNEVHSRSKQTTVLLFIVYFHIGGWINHAASMNEKKWRHQSFAELEAQFYCSRVSTARFRSFKLLKMSKNYKYVAKTETRFCRWFLQCSLLATDFFVFKWSRIKKLSRVISSTKAFAHMISEVKHLLCCGLDNQNTKKCDTLTHAHGYRCTKILIKHKKRERASEEHRFLYLFM